MPDPDHIWTRAQSLLEAVAEAYSDENIPLPDRQLVVEGGPNVLAWDCEQVTVSLARVFRGKPRQESIDAPTAHPCLAIWTAEYHVTIIRCTSTPRDDGSPPTVASVESFAEPILTDAWFLPTAIIGAFGNNCDIFYVGNTITVGPQGAFGGVDLTIEWELGD